MSVVIAGCCRPQQSAHVYLQILERKALCQQDPDHDEEDELEDEQAEYESVLISAASDVVGSLVSIFGPDFSEAFESFIL